MPELKMSRTGCRDQDEGNKMDTPISQQRIPITILTGFLGAGKTTILNHLINSNHMLGVALLINEFGQIGIDHDLVDSADESTVLLNSGCICCTIQEGVVDALKRLFDRAIAREIPALGRILIETTGIADPVPVIQTIMQHPFLRTRFFCEGVVTVVDATMQVQQFALFPEAIKQISSADKVLISKVDLVGANALSKIKDYINSLNPQVKLHEIHEGQIQLIDFWPQGVYSRNASDHFEHWFGFQNYFSAQPSLGLPPQLDFNAAPTQQHSRIGSISLTFEDALPWLQCTVNIGKIIALLQQRLLRCKGILNISGEIKPVVIHAVRGEAYPAIQLERWPHLEDLIHPLGRIVFIINDLEQADIDYIHQQLGDMGSASQALKYIKTHPYLATRSWLKQRISWTPPLIEHQAWFIQSKQFR